MFREIISQFHLLSPPNPSSRWSYLNLDETLIEDNHNNAITKPTNKHTIFKMWDPYNPPPTKKPRKDRKKPSQHSTPTSTMDPTIWNQFPEDLLEAVIARLPISTFFQLRSVSRKWNSLLNSHSFSLHCFQLPQPKPWFYTITHESINSGAIYDPSMRKWRHPTIPTLPPKVILLPVASSGGLICFLDISHRYFYVCNPLTQNWKELPARSVRVWSQLAVGMVQNGRNYKILWVGRDGEYDVYDSSNDSWLKPGGLPPGFKLVLNFRSTSVSIGSTVYILRTDPEGIVSYNVVTRVWKQYLIPTPLDSTDHNLAQSGSHIYMVGLVTKNAVTCVCVWELQRMMMLWKEVDRMPNVWCLEFYGKPIRMTCLGNKGLIMLSLRSRQMNRIVMYDVARREWSKVPGCVVGRGRRRQWIACGTGFYPCLAATP